MFVQCKLHTDRVKGEVDRPLFIVVKLEWVTLAKVDVSTCASFSGGTRFETRPITDYPDRIFVDLLNPSYQILG
jgi:hypothetical protein